jgi:autotransporter-associated beta strand protein
LPLLQAILSIGVSVAALLGGTGSVWAQATWVGGTADYNTNSNWNNSTVPNTTGQSAIFANIGNSNVNVSASVAPDSWTFNANAQAYTITGSAATTVTLTTGLINNSLVIQSIANTIAGSGSVQQNGPSTLTLTGVNTYIGGTVLNAGTLSISEDWNLGAATGGLTFNGGTLQYSTSGALVLSATRAITLNSAGGTFDVANGAPFNVLAISSAIGGLGGLTKIGPGTLALSGINSYSGSTNINAGTLEADGANSIPSTSAVIVANGAALGLGNDVTIGSLAGSGRVFSPISSGNVMLTTGADNTSTTFSGVISNGTALNLTVGLTKVGTGTFTLSGANTYSGPTNVNGGTLFVSGSIIDSSAVVNSGGVLAGTGTVGSTTVNSGGAFAPGSGAPGSAITVFGNLALQSGASYMVQINSAISSLANILGTAMLGGATVNAIYANGSYVAKTYTILTAAGVGGVSGTFNPAVVNTNLPSNFHTTLSYDTHDAYLNLALNFAIPGGLNVNQQNVGNALTNFFNSTGSIPLVFGALTPAGLSKASGETATGTQQTTFYAMTQFLGLMTDPFIGGRGDGINTGSSATPFTEQIDSANAYAARDPARSQSERDAYAAVYRKAPAMVASFVPSWSVWAAGYGGSQATSGNAVLGSNNTTSSIYGTAVGADYRFSPATIAGFALAGGGTNFSVNGFGTGRSDLFQAGVFVRHTVGPAYFTAALAYGWQDITTDRTVTITGTDMLQARFNANAWSGRLEDGYRFATSWMGVTPYAAAQFTTFDLPAYAESVISGANTFALTYGAKSVTDARSEVGIRTDKSWAMPDSIFTLRARFAWAHDYHTDRTIAATFQTLPGASFVVNGAVQAPDSALTTASAEIKWRNGLSVAATFEGEFSNTTTSYAGKGVVRYTW